MRPLKVSLPEAESPKVDSLSLYQRIYLKMDSRIIVFDKFYRQLLESKALLKSPGFFSEGNTLSYNLMGPSEGELLSKYLDKKKGLLLEWGCGLSPCSYLVKDNLELTLLGLDFSKVAIETLKVLYPKNSYLQYHQHIAPSFRYDHLVVTDSLYRASRRGSFKKALSQLLKNCEKTTLIIQNLKVDEEFPDFPAWNKSLTDCTNGFEEHVDSWIDFLQTEDVRQEREKLPLLWDTIAKEMKHHKDQCKNKTISRTAALYERKKLD